MYSLNRKNLLDDLAAALGLDYLSDLHRPEHRTDVLAALKGFIPADYPIAQWNDALCYIFDKPVALSAARQIAAYLDQL